MRNLFTELIMETLTTIHFTPCRIQSPQPNRPAKRTKIVTLEISTLSSLQEITITICMGGVVVTLFISDRKCPLSQEDQKVICTLFSQMAEKP